VWQDEQSGRLRKLSTKELYAKAVELSAAPDERVWMRMSVGLQWSVAKAFAAVVASQKPA
jgi:hypothetical protein